MSGILLWQHLALPRPTAEDVVMDCLREGGMPTFDRVRCETSLCAAKLRRTLEGLRQEGRVVNVGDRWFVAQQEQE